MIAFVALFVTNGLFVFHAVIGNRKRAALTCWARDTRVLSGQSRPAQGSEIQALLLTMSVLAQEGSSGGISNSLMGSVVVLRWHGSHKVITSSAGFMAASKVVSRKQKAFCAVCP